MPRKGAGSLSWMCYGVTGEGCCHLLPLDLCFRRLMGCIVGDLAAGCSDYRSGGRQAVMSLWQIPRHETVRARTLAVAACEISSQSVKCNCGVKGLKEGEQEKKEGREKEGRTERNNAESKGKKGTQRKCSLHSAKQAFEVSMFH